MKKKILFILIIVVILCILFVPAILKLSSNLKIKKDAKNLVDNVNETHVVKNFKSFNRKEKADVNNQENNLKNDSSVENVEEQKVDGDEVTIISLSPLEEIEWLIDNIYIDGINDPHEISTSKDINKIQWENIKEGGASQALRNIVVGINNLLKEIPQSDVLSTRESNHLRKLLIKYSSNIDFLLKKGERNVSAKEALSMVVNSYNSLIDYYDNLTSIIQSNGYEIDLKIDSIKLDNFFNVASIKKIISSDSSFMTGTKLYLKKVNMREVDGKLKLSFNIEVEAKDISRIEIYNQQGLYDSINANLHSNSFQKKQFSISKQYPAEGIYVIKLINSEGNYRYKRYMFYPRITLFPFENGEYKLPFEDKDYIKLDDFFEIKILTRRIQRQFIDKELVEGF